MLVTSDPKLCNSSGNVRSRAARPCARGGGARDHYLQEPSNCKIELSVARALAAGVAGAVQIST